MARSFAPQRDLAAVDAEHTRVAARRAARSAHGVPRKKSQLHQPVGQVTRQVDSIQQTFLVFEEIRQRTEGLG